MNTEKPICNVFLENSASMDGYVKGKTKFESSIYKFLSDIDINSNIRDTLNLNYINSKTIPFSPKDKLEPSTFSSRGGDRGNSVMRNEGNKSTRRRYDAAFKAELLELYANGRSIRS